MGEPTSISATLKTFTRERPGGTVDVDDTFAASVEFASGAIGTLEASRVALGRRNHMVFEINGSNGSLKFNLERLNELEVFSTTSGGFADILVTDSTHPFMQHWWPPGHTLGREPTVLHQP